MSLLCINIQFQSESAVTLAPAIVNGTMAECARFAQLSLLSCAVLGETCPIRTFILLTHLHNPPCKTLALLRVPSSKQAPYPCTP